MYSASWCSVAKQQWNFAKVTLANQLSVVAIVTNKNLPNLKLFPIRQKKYNLKSGRLLLSLSVYTVIFQVLVFQMAIKHCRQTNC